MASQDRSDESVIVVWGIEAEKTRYIGIHGDSNVSTLLKAVTGTPIDKLEFRDKDGIRFGNVYDSATIKQIGHFDADKHVWWVTIIPKQQLNQEKEEKKDNELTKVDQKLHVSTNDVIYSGQKIPWETSKAKINHGIEVLKLKIKPKSNDSILEIHANLIGRRENEISVAALFRSDDENAIYVTCNNGPKGWFVPIILDYRMKSNVTNEIEISIRISGYALNGRANNTTVYDGAITSSLSIKEIL